MATKKRSVQVFECDDRTCKVTHYREKNETEPPGIYGKVREVSGGGSDTESFYACSHDHIVGAIDGALARAWGEEREPEETEGTVEQREPSEVEASNDLTATPEGGRVKAHERVRDKDEF